MVCFSGARSSTLAETLLGIETDIQQQQLETSQVPLWLKPF
jgi:hypothetical protein